MWLSAGVWLTIAGLVSANGFPQVPGTQAMGANNFETGFSSTFDLEEKPDIFSNEDWSSGEPNTAFIAEMAYHNPDGPLAGPDFNLPTSDDWLYQLDAGAPTDGCNAPMSTRTLSKRFQEQCPTEPEERKPLCETELYPLLLCCLGPKFSSFVIVNRCTSYEAFSYFCKLPKYVYCCQSYEADVFLGVVCVKAFPGGDDEEEDVPAFPPSLDAPYPGDPGDFPLFPNGGFRA